MRKRLLLAAAIAALAACGSGGGAATASPSQGGADAAAASYMRLVNGFWEDHVAATSGASQVCLGSGLGTPQLNPVLCKQRGEVMLQVQQKFADALAATSAPPRFAAPDRAIRMAMPATLADLKAMIADAGAGQAAAMAQAALQYIA